MRYLICTVVIVMAVLWSTAAAAGEWTETFSEESLPEDLLEARVVVAVGGPQSDLVGETLINQLDEAGVLEAMLNPVFGDIGQRNDQDVVAALEHLPVDVVVVLRTFDDEEFHEDEAQQEKDGGMAAGSAMLTVYAIDGTALAGFMVYPGEALTREQRRNVGRGISRETLESARDAVEESSTAPGASPAGEFRLEGRGREMELRDIETDETYSGVEIYHRLNEPELAEDFLDNQSRNETLRTIALYSGIAGLAISAAGMGGALYFRNRSVEGHARADECNDYTDNRVQQNCMAEAHQSVYGGWATGGYIAAGVGLATAAIAFYTRWPLGDADIHPINRGEIRERASRLEETGDPATDDTDGQSLQPDRENRIGVAMAPYIRFDRDRSAGARLRLSW